MKQIKLRAFVHVPSGEVEELPTADDMEYSDAVFICSSVSKDIMSNAFGYVLGADTETHIYIMRDTIQFHVYASSDIDTNKASCAVGISLVATLNKLLDFIDKYED